MINILLPHSYDCFIRLSLTAVLEYLDLYSNILTPVIMPLDIFMGAQAPMASTPLWVIKMFNENELVIILVFIYFDNLQDSQR